MYLSVDASCCKGDDLAFLEAVSERSAQSGNLIVIEVDPEGLDLHMLLDLRHIGLTAMSPESFAAVAEAVDAKLTVAIAAGLVS